MAAKLSPAAQAEIEAALGGSQKVLVNVGERKVLIQVVKDDEEFDLDAFLNTRPALGEQLEEAIRQADAGQVVSHTDVKRRLGLAE